MKRFIPIMISFWLAFSAWATQVNLVADPDNWFTPQPHDTLFINEPGKYMLKITQIGKYHIEQTIKDTVELNLQANNIIDEKVRNGLPSTDTLQVSFKNIRAGRRLARGNEYCVSFTKDTCNVALLFEGTCRFTDLYNAGYGLPFVYISGKAPYMHCNIQGAIVCKQKTGAGHLHHFIQTSLTPSDSIFYTIPSTSTFETGGIKNVTGQVVFKECFLKETLIYNDKNSSLNIKDTYYEANDYGWHNAVITSKGKIHIENTTLETNNKYTLINSSDTIFINETNGKTTHINAIIGSKRNSLSETKYSRVIVNKASYIKEISAMADVYGGYIETLCPSPFVKDSLTHADINVFGGKIGQVTNVLRTGGNNTIYNNRNLNIYGGIIGGTKLWTKTGIHLGYTYFYEVPQTGTLLNDTLNLYGGKIQVPQNYSLINFTDNTVINIFHKDNASKRTQFQFHPKHTPATGDYFNHIALIGDSIVGDSLHWEIGDMKHLIGIKSQLITENHLRCSKKAFRLVYKNSQQPNDSLVYGVSKDSTHYFGRLLDTYDVVDIYPAFKRRITYVHTLDETWTTTDTIYYEGFGKQSLPKVIYAGKTFKGWYTEPEGGVKVDSISHLQMGDVTLYTQWGPGQDIIYSDFENSWLCNTGAVDIKYGKDLNNIITTSIKPLEGHNTKAMHSDVTKNTGYCHTLLYLRNSYLVNQSIYNNAPQQYMDLRSTTGISMWHKGIAIYVQIGDDDYRIPQHDELTLVNIPWGQFRTIGRPINLEEVDYLDFRPAVAQGEFWIDDIIFTQGDIYPLETIKIDTVPNKYLYTKNPDLLDIPLPAPKDSTQLFLYPKFTPSDATYQSVVWSSKDPNIATIDKYGRVNAISHGQTYIYCQSVMHPEVKDSILVGVSQGALTYQLHGVSISNQLPTTYTYNTPQAIPAPQPINDFYTFHGWHTDSITGAVVDSASFHQFGNLKAHTLYAEFTREIPGAAITILQNRILAVQNPYHYDALQDARYAWQYNNNPLASQSNFVEVGRPIPTGVYNVNIHIDQEMPISLARTIDNSTINNDDTNTNFTLYPNPIKAGQLAYLIGKFDHILLFDLNGMPVETTILNDGIIKAPQETGMYILKIGVKDQTYTLKLIVI